MTKYLLWGFSKEIKSIIIIIVIIIIIIIIIITFHRLPFIFKVLIQSLPLIIFVFLKSIEFVRYYDYKNIDFVSCNINIYFFHWRNWLNMSSFQYDPFKAAKWRGRRKSSLNSCWRKSKRLVFKKGKSYRTNK